MRNILTVILCLSISLIVYAGDIHHHGHDESNDDGHSHGAGHSHKLKVTDEQLPYIGLYVAKKLSKEDAGMGFGKLDSTWANLSIESSMLYKKENKRNIVAVTNPKENRTLYILISDLGNPYHASFDNHFPPIGL